MSLFICFSFCETYSTLSLIVPYHCTLSYHLILPGDGLAGIILRMHHKRLNLWCINYTLDIQFDFSALVRYANAY